MYSKSNFLGQSSSESFSSVFGILVLKLMFPFIPRVMSTCGAQNMERERQRAHSVRLSWTFCFIYTMASFFRDTL